MERITLSHGGGGKPTRELVENLFVRSFGNKMLGRLDDSALIGSLKGELAFSTDSYVVKPVQFPGGDIGSLSVFGTCNDLAVCGARPLFLSASFVIEEGFPIGTLSKIVVSMAEAAEKCGMRVVAGDTRVVEKGSVDNLFITTSGIGEVSPNARLSLSRVAPGDSVIVSGTVGDHGAAVLSEREGLEFETALVSDVGPVWWLVSRLLDANCDIRFMRDPTRGGLATSLVEIAAGQRWGIVVREDSVPVTPEVKAVCELLSLDPFYVASQGRVVMIVAAQDTSKVLSILRSLEGGEKAAVIGSVDETVPGRVLLKTTAGGTRLLELLHEEEVPRVC